MVDMFEKEVQCTLCPDTFEPLIEPEEDKGAYPYLLFELFQLRPRVTG